MKNAEFELRLRQEVAALRMAITEAMRLHPESEAVVNAIATTLDTTKGSPDPIELLGRVQDNLDERKRVLIEAHPELLNHFK